jgi:hypothetical protein
MRAPPSARGASHSQRPWIMSGSQSRAVAGGSRRSAQPAHAVVDRTLRLRGITIGPYRPSAVFRAAQRNSASSARASRSASR